MKRLYVQLTMLPLPTGKPQGAGAAGDSSWWGSRRAAATKAAAHCRVRMQVQNRALKFGGGIFGLVFVGFGIPFGAAWWQIKKARG